MCNSGICSWLTFQFSNLTADEEVGIGGITYTLQSLRSDICSIDVTICQESTQQSTTTLLFGKALKFFQKGAASNMKSLSSMGKLEQGFRRIHLISE